MSKLVAIGAIAFVTVCAIVLSLLVPPLLARRPTPTAANPAFLTGCSFTKGDAITKVKNFYGIDDDPEKNEFRMPPGLSPQAQQVIRNGPAYTYHFAQYGVWVFFNEQRTLASLRFESPFSGKIGGIALGDDLSAVRALHGEALKFPGVSGIEIANNPELAARRKAIFDAMTNARTDDERMQAHLQMVEALKSPDLHRLPEDTTAWIYYSPSYFRYDIGATSNKVRMIFSDSCTP